MTSALDWKKFGLAFALIAIFPPMFAQIANDRVSEITGSLRSGEFDRALQLIEPALHEFPKNPQLWMLRGLAYSGKGDKKAALSSYQNALKTAPDYLPALEGAAQLEYEAGSPSAIPLLQRVLQLRPNDLTSHAMLAVLAYNKRDCATAVKHFSQSGSLLDSQPGALQEYGDCLMERKETEKAVPIFQRIVASHPNDSRARCALAAVQIAAEQPEAAVITLQPLLAGGQPDVSTMQLAAAAYEANKDTPEAVKMLHDAIVKDPRNTGLYVDFANIALTHQSFQAGIDMLNTGLHLQPTAADLYLARGVLYVQTADYEKAEADFEKAELLDPRQSLTAAALGMVAEEQNQDNPDKALATVRSKLAKRPREAFLWYLQAAILSQTAPEANSPKFHEAVQSARKAVTLQPSLYVARDVLAKLYMQSGETKLAIHECRLALRDDPTDQTALYHLVLALRKTGDRSEIPDLLKRLAKARQDATKEEAERNRYKLLVDPASPSPRGK
ncbi:MAG: tetratricopeptide repeat protein [Candidatus Sulfotelmatobacter sp.]